jgi:hypothetical protein
MGTKARNPSDMRASATQAATLRCEGDWAFGHRSMAVSGERAKKMEGRPRIPCKRKGKGNRPAPAMEMEYVSISHTGTAFSFMCWQTLLRPMMNSTLRNEQETNPAVKRNRVGVPEAPSSLTLRER